jgi:hypothetical protein
MREDQMSAEKIMNETTKMEWVTPKMAAEWLKRNTRNRSLSKAQVTLLANEIKAGTWRVTHQGIAFGADGTLFDGQHRLHAIIAAGTTVPLMVTRGLSQQALDAIDTGNSRHAADVLAIADEKHITTIKRAALMSAMVLVRLGGLNRNAGKATVASLREALEAFEENYDAIAETIKHDRLAQAPAIGAMLICHSLYPGAAIEFAKAYRDPDGQTKDHPAVALREFVLMYYVSGNCAARNDLALRTFSAFVAFRGQRQRKFVRAARVAMLNMLNAWRTSHGMQPFDGGDTTEGDGA